MIRRSLLFIALFVTAGACAKETPTAPSTADEAELRGAPTEITAAGSTLRLETALWRDFMPISPPDGKPLIVVARLEAADGAPVPPSLTATDIMIVFDGSVWSTLAREERPRSETTPVYEVVGRGGPKWGPGVTVDVIVRLSDGTRSWLLRAPDQPIVATH